MEAVSPINKIVPRLGRGRENQAFGLVALLPLVVLFVACSQTIAASPTPTADDLETAVVLRVFDGDTVEVDLEDSLETVRYIGIDATDAGRDGEPAGCFSSEASARNAELVLGNTVWLEADTSDRDSSGRLLRYVYLTDGVMVNLLLVEGGYAGASELPPDTRHSAVLKAANDRAKEAGVGWWEACADSFPRSTSPRRPFECDPAYPSLCIPPSPPDLDCEDIGESGFIALHPDPHRLDGDGNGVACKGLSP